MAGGDEDEDEREVKTCIRGDRWRSGTYGDRYSPE